MKTAARYSVLCITLLLLAWLFYLDFDQTTSEYEEAPSILDENHYHEEIPVLENRATGCSMHTCFDYKKCSSDLKVYVYPDVEGLQPSEVYRKILTAIRESRYFVSDPSQACLFVVSVDTIDRDRISENFVRDVDRYLSGLPSDIWNNGMNHIIFNLYHGTYPDYSDHNLGFSTAKAMIARASPSLQNFRFGFDLSFPLFHKEHPLRSSLVRDVSLRTTNQYLVSFKGKRYVYGIGSETRDSLHHLHNGETVAMVTTCRHNNDWKAYQDARCESDNEAYDKWDYETMMANSTFCLTPRGRRLGSFRFLESLRLGCIPVVLSDDWILPFDEVIDWSAAAVVIPEDSVLLVPDILYTYTTQKIFKMKQRGLFLYYRYFSSVERIVMTSLEIVSERIRVAEGLDRLRWNHFHPFDTSVAQYGVTVIIMATEKPSSRLQKTVSALAGLSELGKIVVLWPETRGVIPIGADFGVKIPLEFVSVPRKRVDVNKLRDLLMGEFIVMIDERLNTPLSETATILEYSRRNPLRLVGVHGLEYDWQKDQLSSERVYNVLFFSLLSFHRYYLNEYVSPIPQALWEECLVPVLNVVVSEHSMQAPIVVGERRPESWMKPEWDAKCYRLLADRWQTGLPLVYSDLRYV
ncbi:hypothetical protein Q1695_011286 [Nippostrongylus brasiliensis]|nr:hypothetical protein Q1695_011286 [Nippostrongylus brasiliensis]